MTVDELVKELNELASQGCGNCDVAFWTYPDDKIEVETVTLDDDGCQVIIS